MGTAKKGKEKKKKRQGEFWRGLIKPNLITKTSKYRGFLWLVGDKVIEEVRHMRGLGPGRPLLR